MSNSVTIHDPGTPTPYVESNQTFGRIPTADRQVRELTQGAPVSISKDYPFLGFLVRINRVVACLCVLATVLFALNYGSKAFAREEGWYTVGLFLGSALGCAVSAELLEIIARIEINTRR